MGLSVQSKPSREAPSTVHNDAGLPDFCRAALMDHRLSWSALTSQQASQQATFLKLIIDLCHVA